MTEDQHVDGVPAKGIIYGCLFSIPVYVLLTGILWALWAIWSRM